MSANERPPDIDCHARLKQELITNQNKVIYYYKLKIKRAFDVKQVIKG